MWRGWEVAGCSSGEVSYEGQGMWSWWVVHWASVLKSKGIGWECGVEGAPTNHSDSGGLGGVLPQWHCSGTELVGV